MSNLDLQLINSTLIKQCSPFIQQQNAQKLIIYDKKRKQILATKCFTDRIQKEFSLKKLAKNITPRKKYKKQLLKTEDSHYKLSRTTENFKFKKYLQNTQIRQPSISAIQQSSTPKTSFKRISEQFSKLSKKLKSQCNLLKGVDEQNQELQNNNAKQAKEGQSLSKLQRIPFKKTHFFVEKLDSEIVQFEQSGKISLSTAYSVKKKTNLQDFIILKYLGQGKFGKVELVIHKASKCLYALKTIRKQDVSNQELKQQLVLEIKIQSCLNHPNITKLYEHFYDKKNIYLLCEFLSGGHLYAHLMKKKFLNQSQVSSYAHAICSAVGFMHDNNIIHRDLKPQNIILEYGVPKVCDFGWSIHSKNMRQTCCGTPLYLSPQLTKGQAYDNKVDVWTIGVLIFQLLTGKPPFKISIQNGLAMNIDQSPKYPSYLSDSARSFLEALLEKDPRDRASISDIENHSFLKLGIGFSTT